MFSPSNCPTESFLVSLRRVMHDKLLHNDHLVVHEEGIDQRNVIVD